MDRRDFLKTAIAAGALWRDGFAAEPRIKLAVSQATPRHFYSIALRA